MTSKITDKQILGGLSIAWALIGAYYGLIGKPIETQHFAAIVSHIFGAAFFVVRAIERNKS